MVSALEHFGVLKAAQFLQRITLFFLCIIDYWGACSEADIPGAVYVVATCI